MSSEDACTTAAEPSPSDTVPGRETPAGSLYPWFHRRPILLAGLPRTATSWTAKILSLGGPIRYVREPLTQTAPARPADQRFCNRYLLADDEAPEYRQLWANLLSPATLFAHRWMMAESRWTTRRLPLPAPLLVKEVSCMLSLEWLQRHLGMRVVLVLRHPCGYVSSVQRLKGVNHKVFTVASLLDDPRLVERYAADDLDWLLGLDDPVAQHAATYGLVLRVVADQLERHPEWVVIRHRSLCEDPIGVARRLVEAVGLRYTPALDRFLGHSTRDTDGQLYSLQRKSAQEPGKWMQELSPSQISTVHSVIERFRLPFYRDFA